MITCTMSRENARKTACQLVQTGRPFFLRKIFEQKIITPNTQGEKHGLAPVHYVAQLFGKDNTVSSENSREVIRILREFNGDFSLTGAIPNSAGIIKNMSAMDMIVTNARRPGAPRDKYETAFLAQFEPVEITRALRSVPTSAPHPDLLVTKTRDKEEGQTIKLDPRIMAMIKSGQLRVKNRPSIPLIPPSRTEVVRVRTRSEEEDSE